VAPKAAQDHDTPSDASTDRFAVDVLMLAIISRAQTHRAKASDSRLTVGPLKTTYNSSHTGSKFTNLSNANQVTIQWRQKKLEARLREGLNKAMTIVASLWQIDERAKLIEVSIIHACIRLLGIQNYLSR